MDYTDMNLSTQISLISLIVIVWAGFLVRTVIFFRRENAGSVPQYPNGWNEKQCRALEPFRLLIALGLVTLRWGGGRPEKGSWWRGGTGRTTMPSKTNALR